MQVRLLQDCRGPNPDYDYSLAPEDQDAPREIELPAGTLIDHPDAHYLMRKGLAEPVDDEACESHERHKLRKRRLLEERAERVRQARKNARRV